LPASATATTYHLGDRAPGGGCRPPPVSNDVSGSASPPCRSTRRLVDPDDVRRAIEPGTVLVSIMHANNEVGTVQPIAEIAESAHERGVLVHTGAAQSVGKITTDVDALGVGHHVEHVEGLLTDPVVVRPPAKPASGHSDPALDGDADRHIILVCDEGYQSSLAAATLHDLGFTRATDLAGGFQAWRAAGLPVEQSGIPIEIA
jgi:rhodanese-related sulfurtransferase